LNVVENQNPGIEVGLGNPGSVFFSYGGNTPGPTVRMRGNETLAVKLRNLLGEDCGQTFVGPFPDLGEIPPPDGCPPPPPPSECDALCEDPENPASGNTCPELARRKDEIVAKGAARGQLRPDFCLGEHTNGLHAAHVTNLHTHGLHVRPDRNPDGTQSDNVILRVLPQEDFKRRERAVLDGRDAACQKCGHPAAGPVCEKCGADVDFVPPCGVESEPAGPGSACLFLRRDDELYFLRDDELAGEADYEFRLGNLPGFEFHPPGTHWYHPHAHGATDIQVSSGMAGYLIVEGDVDDAINCALTGAERPDPTEKTGPWDYRERLMFMQRIFPGNIEGDPQSPRSQLHRRPVPATNGSEKAGVINMRPGAIERWRVLNGSVDGRGFKRFMVLKGQYELVTTGFQSNGDPCTELVLVDPGDGHQTPVTFKNYDELIEARKCRLHQLAIDGVTLVKEKDGQAIYFIKDLSQQGKGTKYPPSQPCSDPVKEKLAAGRPNAEKLCRIENVFADCASVKNTWVRPDEFFMGPANRTDVLFQLPLDARCGDVFTVLAKASVVHADTPVFNLQKQFNNPHPAPGPSDVLVAHVVVVCEEPVPGAAADKCRGVDPTAKVMNLNDCLPPAPPYLRPIRADELTDDRGKYRTRVVHYSGWGNEGLPLITTEGHDDPRRNPTAHAFHEFIQADKKRAEGDPLKDLEKLRYVDSDGVQVLMPPRIRTMSIDGRKFNPKDPKRPQVLVDTCEQWIVYNTSQTLWANTDTAKHPQRGQYRGHYRAYPVDRATGEEHFWTAENVGSSGAGHCPVPDFRIVSRGIDHPFHIHQNPFWVLRIEIPDQHGNLCNILDEPRWMDSLWIPRNNGRIVFRSRFPDFVGAAVHHCHILQHEDNGMMTAVQLTPFPDEANDEKWDCAVERQGVTGVCTRDGKPVEDLARPSLEASYVLNFTFVDPNLPSGSREFVDEEGDPPSQVRTPDTGQVYPGFPVTAPKPPWERYPEE
jgi:FtsP/CotA-like multicopper oxidase with cupredoxin domain